MNMTIGQLADKSKTEAQTIRYYERQGLLPEPQRSESNYRVYNEDVVEQLVFIRRAKEIGFSLNDIKKLIEMANGTVRKCSVVKEFAETRLFKIRNQIADLKAMEKTLSNLVQQCEKSKKITECPILETMSEKK